VSQSYGTNMAPFQGANTNRIFARQATPTGYQYFAPSGQKTAFLPKRLLSHIRLPTSAFPHPPSHIRLPTSDIPDLTSHITLQELQDNIELPAF
jgi:hypothetical protein